MIKKDLPGYEGLYQITDDGRVYSLISNKFLKEGINNKGYHKVELYKNKIKKTMLVHRLVAMVFLENPNPEKFNQVNHKNGNKNKNDVSNLEWCDQFYNMKHASENNLLKDQRGKKLSKETKLKMSKTRKGHPATYHKKVAQINPDTNEIIKIFNSTYDAAKEIGCHHTSISEVCRHKNNRITTKGYKWEYI